MTLKNNTIYLWLDELSISKMEETPFDHQGGLLISLIIFCAFGMLVNIGGIVYLLVKLKNAKCFTKLLVTMAFADLTLLTVSAGLLICIYIKWWGQAAACCSISQWFHIVVTWSGFFGADRKKNAREKARFRKSHANFLHVRVFNWVNAQCDN